jgi:hypothetical protein
MTTATIEIFENIGPTVFPTEGVLLYTGSHQFHSNIVLLRVLVFSKILNVLLKKFMFV